jgi:hypothetical protein
VYSYDKDQNIMEEVSKKNPTTKLMMAG